ncbi:alpha/beta fold hydrolase [Siphonobacter sp. SORGH_AS_1065]|uniref:alpha/beta fold hydrolase n=1 Tax=Siphonobacter sp. SORGH_AS_1065 TaxID=3041795 RepID=UPI00278A9526|nr:alpha/beta hydrolase [Siphonobacter sp. SORGH_AS_1065]MDQ1087363.1 non-heme chloroperoxidase [Siphonobacter sp. SORGH_AS_1065]
MAYIETAPGVQVFVEDWGQGQPVVFLHGWPLNHKMFEYQVNQIANHYRCILIDRRGFGDSDKPWQGYDYDTLSDDLAAVLDALDLYDVTLVGFSQGGAEAIHYMARHQGRRVSKLVLLGAAAPHMLKTEDFPDGVDKSTFDDMIEKSLQDRAAFIEDFSKQFFGVSLLNNPVSSKLADWFHSLAMEASPKATVENVLTFSQADLRADLPGITVPTLIIHGTSDQVVPFEISGKLLSENIPNSQLIAYEGAPHGFFYTEWPRLNQDLLDFFATPVLTETITTTTTW